MSEPPSSTLPADASTTLAVRVELDPRINFALQQNDVPVVKALRVENLSDAPLGEFDVLVTCEPDVASPWRRRVPGLAPHGRHDLHDVDLQLSPEVLGTLTERVRGRLRVQVLGDDVPPIVHDEPIELLAWDEWSGCRSLPEILAAFVTPNHPALAGLLRRAAALLRAWTGDDALSGYQSRSPARVLQMAAAVYAALADAGIGYVDPPPGFETDGQRVRLPGRVLEQGLGTCLDLALLAAAALEACGLHPLLVLTRGHAFTGVWLGPECFPEPTSDDVVRLRKRVALDEIAVFDPTLATSPARPPFEAAAAAAKRRLQDDDDFTASIDVRRARIGQIRPIPERVPAPPDGEPGVAARDGSTPPALPPDTSRLDALANRTDQPAGARGAGGAADAAGTASTAGATGATGAAGGAGTGGAIDANRRNPTQIDAIDAGVAAGAAGGVGAADTTGAAATAEAPPETAATRLDRWRSRLLDLSLRNRLLNFRETKKTIPLLCRQLALFENRLADGREFVLLPRPTELGGEDPRDDELHRRRTGVDAAEALLADDLQAGRLRGGLTESELQRRLVEVFRAARVAQEEGGASQLFVTLGMLAWDERDAAGARRLAPILMVPVRLQRRSVHEGFRLLASDEETTVNVTLVEMLRKQHGIEVAGLDPLPGDENGVDVEAVLRRFREAVRDVGRWEVLEQAWVGLFSFTKFVMWRDLCRREDLLEGNRVVEHLVHRPHEAFPSTGEFPRAERLDDDRSPETTYCPLSADSSQLAAVLAAADGRSFVLEGPPGTGKSQTITNLVAHCLAEGKRVLFVSEKMAALEVVYRRLSQLGLERFCLELHSNKASRREVVQKLAQALETAAQQAPDDWERQARRLEGLRNALNAYVRALHLRRATGETVFEVTSRLIGLRQVPRLALDLGPVAGIDRERLADLRERIEKLETASAACRGLAEHPWREVRRGDWGRGWQEHVLELIDTLLRTTSELRAAVDAVAGPLALDGAALSPEQLEQLAALCEVLGDCPRPPRALLVDPEWDAIQDELATWIEHGKERDALRAELFSRYDEHLARALPVTALTARLRAAEASRWPLSWWRRRPVVAALRGAATTGGAPSREALAGELQALSALQAAEARMEQVGARARELLQRQWCDGNADWDGLASLRDWARRFRELARRLSGGDPARAAALRETWARLATEQAEWLAPEEDLGRALAAVRTCWSAWRASLAPVVEQLDLDVQNAWGGPGGPAVLGRVEAAARRWRAHPARLGEWCAWRRMRAEAVEAGLLPLVEFHESGAHPDVRMADVFERSFAHWWLTAVVDAEPVLRRFTSAEHERKIDEFRRVDARYTELTRQLVQARLAARVPAGRGGMRTSEVGILQVEIGKKRRHLALRQLFARIPNLLPRLQPCLLMSPISVAQYLDERFPPFDLVVFDEASQIPAWDAVGAIARGEQVVVVGDRRQLPPTSFFQRADDDEDGDLDEDIVEDQDSILDDCIAAGLPRLPLEWHYRSRHESLIAFSNHHYYENRLLTFPSPVREGLGVTWRPVPHGVYDRSRSRTNEAEARAVVEEIVARLSDPARCHRSIGVVTFSQAQQALVEDLLDQARLQDRQLERFFSDETLEPLFVKNLENVQGDERDVILFTVGYGPDAQGRVSMGFGPLNREGGERRLNVAITRARWEVLVFSTLRADQIDLNRTRARGVRDLKTFLDYAERGALALAEASHPTGGEPESPFEQQVAEALAQRGWEVHGQVGCSGYRIDLAVVDPAAPGRYLLGIECDGAHYHSARTARDRDRLREEVLRGLGWEIHRIWSTDWWTDPQHELQELETALEEARAAQAARRREQERGEAEARRLAGAGARGEEEGGPSLPTQPASAGNVAAADGHPEVGATPSAPAAPVTDERDVADRAEDPASVPGGPAHAADELPAYEVATDLGPLPGSLYDAGSQAAVRRALERVVQVEAPVLLDVAAVRVGQAFGLGRVSRKAVEHIAAQIPHCAVKAQAPAEDEVVLWRQGDEPGTWRAVRAPGASPSARRTIAEIPLVELANALERVLARHVAAPVDDLLREAARPLGVARMGAHVAARMRRALDLLVARGAATSDGEQATHVG